MKKLILLSLTVFVYANICGQDAKLTSAQQTQVRRLVGDYYKYLQMQAEKPVYDMEIIPLFSSQQSEVYDDVVENKKIHLDTYLKHIGMYDGTITFSISEDIQNVPIEGIATQEIIKSTGAKVAITVLTKHTDINHKEKTTPNTFIVDLQKCKIFKIEGVNRDEFFENLSTVSANEFADANTEMSDNLFSGWYMQAHLLYKSKKYEASLAMFERAAQHGHLESQYEAGLMYFLNKGCKNLNKKEREKRGYDWLTKAAAQMPEGSRYNKARQTLDALGYY